MIRNIKRKVIVVIVVILLSFGAIITFYQYNLVKKNFDHTVLTLNKTIYNTFEVLLNQLKINLSIKTDAMIDLPPLQTALYNKNRKELLKIIEPFYKRMTAQNPYIKIMTFRLADGSAFLRVHKPNMFGDALNKKRKIIIDTNRLQKRQYGFEVGKLKMSYRVVTPIFYKNQYLGLVEIGVEPEYVTDKLNDIFEIKNGFLVKTDTLLHISDEMKENVISDFMLVKGDDIFKDNLKDIKLNEDITIKDKGRNYIIADDLNVPNHKDEVAAKILLAYNIDNYLYKVNKTIFDIVLHMSLLIIVLLVILNYFINYLLNKMNILNRELASKSIELEDFNNTLIDKIEKEVAKNRKKDKQLLQQSRLAQMGEMLSMIAHQWRQPLAAISATSNSLYIKSKQDKLNKDKVMELSQKISEYTQHLSITIDDFREFFKPNKKNIEINYHKLIKSVLAIVETSIRNKNIHIIQDLNCNETFTTYPNELKQVILNLIKNAEDVLLEKKIKDPTIKIVTYTKEDRYILEISDNAGGIPEDIIEKIFDPYFSTKKEKDGTGLGLYMSKMIIEEHCCGELTVANMGNGALFKVVLHKGVI